jgi:endonuclease III
MKNLLLEIAKDRLAHPSSQLVPFIEDEDANNLLNNLETFPHAFVLARLMDRQIKAERAWAIPYAIYKELNTFSIKDMSVVGLAELRRIFSANKLHRFNDTMASVFHSAIQRINNQWDGNAGNIWSSNPSSSAVVYRFLEFDGSGIKISTMAANILARRFRVPFSDYYSIDISPDVHVIRVMKRMGFVPADANNDMVIYKAREITPEFPGIIDFSCWEIGRGWCHPKYPNCVECIASSECEKRF